MGIEQQAKYYAVFAETTFTSWAEVQQRAAREMNQHIARSKQLHGEGKLLMAGAFMDRPEEPVTTMGVLVSREDAEAYMREDPFVVNGMVRRWYIREWANMFYAPNGEH